MRLTSRFAVIAAVYILGLLVLAALAKPDLPGFLLAGFVGVLLFAAVDRLRLSRFLGRPSPGDSSSDIRRR